MEGGFLWGWNEGGATEPVCRLSSRVSVGKGTGQRLPRG